MTFGTSLVLIAVGAILRYAVTATVSGIDLQVVGLVLMIVGVVGLVISLLWFGVWAGRRREVPPVEREVRDRNLYSGSPPRPTSVRERLPWQTPPGPLVAREALARSSSPVSGWGWWRPISSGREP